MKSLFILCVSLPLFAITIIDRPIQFNQKRINLSKTYLKQHYGLSQDTIQITPKMIVVHATALDDLEASFKRFDPPVLLSDRTDIQKASSLNVSAHFLIDRDGTIYRLMPETFMARHVIGLNHCAIGIENVGGEEHADDLSSAQLESNRSLIAYLLKKYQSIDYLIAHYEYQDFEHHPLWMEKDLHYRTQKHDPGPLFMKSLRQSFPTLKGRP